MLRSESNIKSVAGINWLRRQGHQISIWSKKGVSATLCAEALIIADLTYERIFEQPDDGGRYFLNCLATPGATYILKAAQRGHCDLPRKLDDAPYDAIKAAFAPCVTDEFVEDVATRALELYREGWRLP